MRITSIRDVAVAVRARRQQAGLSQEALARRAGVSRKWVYEFEAGKPTAELGLLLRVLDALDLEVGLSSRGDAPGGPAAGADLDALLDGYRDDG
jgi:HTH-type transcriptional regulator/antitoxin HipB